MDRNRSHVPNVERYTKRGAIYWDTSEKPMLSRDFNVTSRLKQHSFYHTGERNYPCRVCEMRFFSNFQLKVHMRTHTKSFPYKCSVCNKRFRYRHMAKEHIVKDHGIDISLQKDWVIQYPEPDPEEVEVINEEENIIQYNIQRLEETEDEDNTLGEGADSATSTSSTVGPVRPPNPPACWPQLVGDGPAPDC
uniref:C2H2-type domain-containing protein n=1 Tax=Anopheles melas TaxID=34690 RepID=A0A182TLS7_9DIPT